MGLSHMPLRSCTYHHQKKNTNSIKQKGVHKTMDTTVKDRGEQPEPQKKQEEQEVYDEVIHALSSCFHIPNKEELTPTFYHSSHHSYHYFVQTVNLIHLPSFSTNLKSVLHHSLKQKHQSLAILNQILKILQTNLEIYQRQYELCKNSIQKEQELPEHLLARGNQFKAKRKIESLKRQLEELELHASGVYEILENSFQEYYYNLPRDSNVLKRRMIKWIINLCGKLSLNSTDNTISEHSSVKPVAKRQRIEQMFFGYSRMNIGTIIDKAEQNQLCQTLLSLLKLFF
jgi:hypothetical protein